MGRDQDGSSLIVDHNNAASLAKRFAQRNRIHQALVPDMSIVILAGNVAALELEEGATEQR